MSPLNFNFCATKTTEKRGSRNLPENPPLSDMLKVNLNRGMSVESFAEKQFCQKGNAITAIIPAVSTNMFHLLVGCEYWIRKMN